MLKTKHLYLRNNFMAGDESSAGNPLLVDLISVGRKLEQLDSTYYMRVAGCITPILTRGAILSL